MTKSIRNAKQKAILDKKSAWCFPSSMEEALNDMDVVLDEMRANTKRIRSTQPRKRIT